MIILDTTILVHAAGAEHPLRDPSQALLRAIGERRITDATTTIEVIQEFAHVRARRERSRTKAVELARDYTLALAPLLLTDVAELRDGLVLFGEVAQLGAFDAVLAAVALRHSATLVSADRAFAEVPGLHHLDPASPDLFEDLGIA